MKWSGQRNSLPYILWRMHSLVHTITPEICPPMAGETAAGSPRVSYSIPANKLAKYFLFPQYQTQDLCQVIESSVCWFVPKMAKAKSLKLHPALKYLTIFCTFSKCTGKKLDQKWSSQDLNSCPDAGITGLHLAC